MEDDDGAAPGLAAAEGLSPVDGFGASLAGAGVGGDVDDLTGVAPAPGVDPGPYAGAGGGGTCLPCSMRKPY